DHAEIRLRYGIGPPDLPGIDARIIDTQRRPINVDVGGCVALALQPARRHDPYILDRAALQHPAEVPLARPLSCRSVGEEARDVETPRTDQPTVEVHVAGAIGRGTRGVEAVEESRERAGLGCGHATAPARVVASSVCFIERMPCSIMPPIAPARS